jgi:ABC-2 type transport system ATP-binding protein
MAQRLAIAVALLGDPGVLVLDEPLTSLDPAGMRWISQFLRSLAAEGRTVFVASQVLSELEPTADRLVVLGRGRLLAEAGVAELLTRAPRTVRVCGPDAGELHGLVSGLASFAAEVRWLGDGGLVVSGVSAGLIGDLAFDLGVRLHELCTAPASLEQVYLKMTAGAVRYRDPAFQEQRIGFV